MSDRGAVADLISNMKDVMKKVERVVQAINTFYKTEGMPEVYKDLQKDVKK